LTRIAAVYGAPTPPGRLALALDVAVAALEAGGASVERIDLHAAPPDDEAVAVLDRAGAVLVASPVYRASFPGVLKTLLDLAPVSALRGKPVGLVVVAASDHHYLGVDRHLRDVLSWFGALALPVSVYLTSRDFGEDGLGNSARASVDELAADLLRLTRAVSDAPPGLAPLAAQWG
jgi:FMN reductase